MPMYDFQCRQCGKSFEELVRWDQTPPCPACQATNVEKLVSAPAGHVAGGGGSLPVMGACAPPPGQHSCGSGCRHN